MGRYKSYVTLQKEKVLSMKVGKTIIQNFICNLNGD